MIFTLRNFFLSPYYGTPPRPYPRLSKLWDFFFFFYLKQYSEVWALSRSKPTFLWNDPFELIFHARLLKTNRFSSFRTKSLRKKILGQNLDFCKSYFQFLRWNWVFRTNMEGNAVVTLHFEDLAVQNCLFLKDVCIC